MENMFYGAEAFNQPLSDWQIDEVTDMFGMFYDAESFNQDLGWCVGDDVDLGRLPAGRYAAFELSGCERTSCGVAIGQFKTEDGGCESTPAPTETDAARRGGRVAVALVVGAAMTLLA